MNKLRKACACKQGFTLTEMLIVIVVVAILISIGFVSYQGVLRRGRDQRRMSDLARIRLALESYAADHTSDPYPPNLDVLVTSRYLESLPQDPQFYTAQYYYKEVVKAGAESYILCAYLEREPTDQVIVNRCGSGACAVSGSLECNYLIEGI